MTALYLAALIVLGISLVGWASYTYRHLSTRGGVLLGLGIALPWVAVILPEVTNYFEGQPVLATSHVVIGAILGVTAVSRAVFSHDLFATVPAAGTVGRQTTVEEMSAPVLVVDVDYRLIDLNAAAERTFDVTGDPIGTPLGSDAVDTPAAEELFRDGTGRTTITHEQRTFEVAPSELHDDYGRVLGYSILLLDITDRQRREQRIQVLNRVLRHNLRNDMNAIHGYAELVAERGSGPDEYAERIQEMSTDLLAIGEKAREIEEIFTTDRVAVPLSDVLKDVVGTVRSEFPESAISVNSSVEPVAVNGAVLAPALRELLTNGLQHNTAENPWVEITVERAAVADGSVRIQVADNGPGIPDHELAPLRDGAETDLEHGSGLGLWLVKWAVTRLNGELEFARDRPDGTVATLSLQPATEHNDV